MASFVLGWNAAEKVFGSYYYDDAGMQGAGLLVEVVCCSGPAGRAETPPRTSRTSCWAQPRRARRARGMRLRLSGLATRVSPACCRGGG